MRIAIRAIGTASPRFSRPQTEALEFVAQMLQLNPTEKRLLRALYKGTRIEYRHSVLEDYLKKPGEFTFFSNNLDDEFPSTGKRMSLFKLHAFPLALAAIHDCLNELNDFDPTSITHLITVSCTGMYAPGIDIEIIKELQLNTSVHRFSINFMGCYAAFNAIKIAHAACLAYPQAKVLIVCVELGSIHFQKSKSLDSLTAGALFADGAAAILVQAEPPEQQAYFSLESFYTDLIPQTQDDMAWHITDYGFDMVLSSYIPQAIEKGINQAVQKLLNQKLFQITDIDYFAVHTGGVKILQACEHALGITEEDNRYSYEVLRQFGNLSSPTVLFVLKKIWQNLTSKDHNKNIFSCSFGPGLTFESMLLKTHYV